MQYPRLIEDIIKNVPFSVNTTRPSYVERLLPDLDDQAFIIFHKNVSEFYLILYILLMFLNIL